MKKFYILSRAMEITRQYSRLPITRTKKVGVIGSSKEIKQNDGERMQVSCTFHGDGHWIWTGVTKKVKTKNWHLCFEINSVLRTSVQWSTVYFPLTYSQQLLDALSSTEYSCFCGEAGEKERERAGHDRKDENFPARFLFFRLLLFSQGYPAENFAEERVLAGKKHFYLQFNRVRGCVRATRSLHDEVHTVDSRLLEPSLTRTSRLLISPRFPL